MSRVDSAAGISNAGPLIIRTVVRAFIKKTYEEIWRRAFVIKRPSPPTRTDKLTRVTNALLVGRSVAKGPRKRSCSVPVLAPLFVTQEGPRPLTCNSTFTVSNGAYAQHRRRFIAMGQSPALVSLIGPSITTSTPCHNTGRRTELLDKTINQRAPRRVTSRLLLTEPPRVS